MISAMAFVLFVRDKYTINTLVVSETASILGMSFFVSDIEQAEIKREIVKSTCIIDVIGDRCIWCPYFGVSNQVNGEEIFILPVYILPQSLFAARRFFLSGQG